MGKLEPLCTVNEDEIGAAAIGNSMRCLKKLEIELPYDPEIPLLGIDPKELKAGT